MSCASLREPLLRVLLTVSVAACTHIALYDQRSYELATSTKAEALITMNMATEPYLQHQHEVAALQLDMQKAYEYAHGQRKNEVIGQMWAKLNDPEGEALGGFLRRWKASGTLSEQYVAQKKLQIAEDFDQIIDLERGKNRSAK